MWKNVIVHCNRKTFLVEVNRNVFAMSSHVIRKIRGLNYVESGRLIRGNKDVDAADCAECYKYVYSQHNADCCLLL